MKRESRRAPIGVLVRLRREKMERSEDETEEEGEAEEVVEAKGEVEEGGKRLSAVNEE